MSDLTPEETLRREFDRMLAQSKTGFISPVLALEAGLAAVAAERERIVKLLRDEAELALEMDATHAPAGRAVYDTLRFAGALVAREGDTTGS